ncbi:putative secreted protein (Por secretion system target) [Gelidibacter sediminis]|uniref:Putative secreted protein (Por secretion system target) n=1 Tax=Gelidibacter sediminis TaxID=1608710 RepID=A0A4R7Q853_9FLAO|nr:T9SS type A sorting domain-containing protein [Gelidibacter sediminis]TDU42910.1 putative secreted protein (Por secretion system target) [Gelidibacter sediminis]
MKKLYFILLALLTVNLGYAQIPVDLAAIEAINIIGPTSTNTAGNVTATGFQRGSGVTRTTDGSHDGFMSKGFDKKGLSPTIAQNKFIKWSVGATAADYSITISDIRLALTRGNTDVATNFTIEYSTDNQSTWNLLGNGSHGSQLTNERFIFSTSITSTFGGTVHFRLYAYDEQKGNGEDGPYGIGKLNTLFDTNNLMQNPGILMRGTVNFDGLEYNDGVWTPLTSNGPSSSTGDKNVIIKSGTYIVGGLTGINKDIQVKNMRLFPGTQVIVPDTASVIVNESLYLQGGEFILNSSSTKYSSLIVEDGVDGEVTYKRHVNSSGNDLISAPVVGQRFDKFVEVNTNIKSSTDGSLLLFGPYKKNPGTYEFWTPTTKTQLLSAQGYRAGSTDNGTFTFKGTVNTGDLPRPILYSAGSASSRWNLIGNPFPSYLKAYEFLDHNLDQLDPDVAAIYGYNAGTATTNTWTVWNLANLPIKGNPSLTPGQAFYVAAQSNGGTVDFMAAWRRTAEGYTDGKDDDFILGRPGNSKLAHTELKISNGTNSFKTELYFNDKSTKAMDVGYDAVIFGEKAPSFSIYSHLVEDNKGLDMTIQSLAYEDLSNEIVIPIGINATKGQQVTVSLQETVFPEGTEVYLEDNVTDTFTLLTNSDYKFTVNSTLKGTGRFFLRISNRTLSEEETFMSNGLQIYSKLKTVYIKGVLLEPTNATIYDIQGRVISSTTLKAGSNDNQINLPQVTSGVYIVKLTSKSQEKSQKVIIK